MKATIYIRKENEDWWKEFGSSAWVNETIHLVATDPKRAAEKLVGRPKWDTLCKHGYAKGNCKFGC